ncbi:histidinol-phosphate transaminase [Altererythrobacter arenosus]|uniref:Histidinol-phosphate aminotransferase n=1 Tax=Altererythrobacter arenosus TaxID=3032592 RepID=A0ABY8FW74_9SPHN|nr:histidinol-phosphate transaminase [Altererythrobacter sp. CAU 1644]WFL78320.1 histidinol-phosphate transaminase [Altererythrobacter sp. CAU 1644]
MSEQKPAAKPWILGIHAYVPGKARSADGRALIKLSANENPLGTSEVALAARSAAAGPAHYPDPGSTALREAIGALHGIDPARIVCGTGSDELLNLAAQGFAGPGDEVLFGRYSFAVYDIAARRCGATPVEAADRDYALDVDALLGAVTEKTRVVFVANPNNPTGTYMPRAELERLHDGLPRDLLLVVDQAYAEYLGEGEDDGGMELAARHDNVLVTRTFSKIYGLAGERVGWATGAPHLVDVLNRIRGPFNVTASGQAAALAALGDLNFVAQSREHNAAELARFTEVIESLGNHGLRAVPSKANFLLVLFEGELKAVTALDAIAEAGYAVRHIPVPGLSDALRITIGRSEDMAAIAEVLRSLTGETA